LVTQDAKEIEKFFMDAITGGFPVFSIAATTDANTDSGVVHDVRPAPTGEQTPPPVVEAVAVPADRPSCENPVVRPAAPRRPAPRRGSRDVPAVG